MSTDEVIQKLYYIEQDSKAIWKSFSKFYKPGFFYGQIEAEFGITPQTHDTLVKRFDDKVDEFKEQCKLQIENLTNKFEGEISRLKGVIRDKDILCDHIQSVCKIDKENFEIQLRKDFEQKSILDQKEFSRSYFLEK